MLSESATMCRLRQLVNNIMNETDIDGFLTDDMTKHQKEVQELLNIAQKAQRELDHILETLRSVKNCWDNVIPVHNEDYEFRGGEIRQKPCIWKDDDVDL